MVGPGNRVYIFVLPVCLLINVMHTAVWYIEKDGEWHTCIWLFHCQVIVFKLCSYYFQIIYETPKNIFIKHV